MSKKETVKSRLSSTDLVARIVCVLVALVVWLYVVYNTSEDYEMTFDGISVDIKNTAVLSERGLTVFGEAAVPVEVTVFGKRGDIFGYKKEDISASVDVSAITEAGVYELAISPSAPDNAAVKRFYPQKVTLNVQQVTEKPVPVLVKPVFSSTFEKGEALPSSETVTVKGPAPVVDSITHVEARPKIAELVTSSLSISGTPLVACTKSGTEVDGLYLDVSPATVDIEIPIYDTKTVPIKVKTLHGYLTSANSTITTSPATVNIRTKITGGRTLENVEFIETEPLDETTLKGDALLTLALDFPDGVESVGDVRSVFADIAHKNTEIKTLEVDTFRISNPDNIEYTLKNTSIKVSLRTTYSTAVTLSAKDLVIEGSLRDLKNGRIPVRVILSQRYESTAYVVGNYFIEVSADK